MIVMKLTSTKKFIIHKFLKGMLRIIHSCIGRVPMQDLRIKYVRITHLPTLYINLKSWDAIPCLTSDTESIVRQC